MPILFSKSFFNFLKGGFSLHPLQKGRGKFSPKSRFSLLRGEKRTTLTCFYDCLRQVPTFAGLINVRGGVKATLLPAKDSVYSAAWPLILTTSFYQLQPEDEYTSMICKILVINLLRPLPPLSKSKSTLLFLVEI